MRPPSRKQVSGGLAAFAVMLNGLYPFRIWKGPSMRRIESLFGVLSLFLMLIGSVVFGALMFAKFVRVKIMWRHSMPFALQDDC